MSVTAIDHLVLLFSTLDEGIATWTNITGAEPAHVVRDASGVDQAFFTLPDRSFIELLAPSGEDSPLSELLSKRGEGMHVVALQVDNLEAAVATLQAEGRKLIGVGTDRVFIHPSSAGGVMVQLWPADKPHRWRDNLEKGESS